MCGRDRQTHTDDMEGQPFYRWTLNARGAQIIQQEVDYQGGLHGGGDPQAICKEEACGRPAHEAGRTGKAGDGCCWIKGC